MDVWMNDKKTKPMITTNLMSMTITSGDDHGDILRLKEFPYLGQQWSLRRRLHATKVFVNCRACDEVTTTSDL